MDKLMVARLIVKKGANIMKQSKSLRIGFLSKFVVGVMLGLWMVPAFVSGADKQSFSTKITNVTVFKDGHALFMARGSAQPDNGWCHTRDVPVPVLGTFWTYAAQKNVQVDFIKAGFVDTQQIRPCLTLDEMIQANTGKEVIIFEQPSGTVSHQGILRGILQHEAREEVTGTHVIPSRRDSRGNWQPERRIGETQVQENKHLASFIMLETDEGVKLIKRDNIRGISLTDKNPATTKTENKKVREISLHLSGKKSPFNKKVDIGMVYLQKGIRWIPDYRIELLEDGQARVTLQGTIINDVADLENVSLGLVVGVPSFLMKDQLSPLALREMSLSLSSYFRPADESRGNHQVQYLSNALMSQRAAVAFEEDAGGFAGGVDIPIEGRQEDHYVYHKDGITLKKGQRAVVQLFTVTVPYEDIYTWEIPPVPPRYFWRHINQQQQQQLAQALSAAKGWHEIRLTNTSQEPWTTGPAFIFKGRTPLGQQMLTYTSVKNTVDVPITIATDLNTKKQDVETNREQNIRIAGNDYIKVYLHGKLTVKNFKDRPVRMILKRKLFGLATAATADGKILQTNIMEDTSGPRERHPWYSWNWPWWWHVNAISEISWETQIDPGKSALFEYDYHYFYRN